MINRENYEEFFLSYVDNELPAETRLAVERFVAAHPDLREELDALLQCRLEPESDTTVFPHKDSLLQYEGSLLLYVDHELDDAGRKNVEELLRQHPHLETELKRLQITVNQPDPAIVFPDKESLYHPVKRRRAVMMPWLQAGVVMRTWLQAGVAAAILAAVVFLALPHGKKTGPPSVAKNNPAVVTPPATSPLYSGKKDEATRTETNTQTNTETNVATANPVKAGTTTKKTTPNKTPTLPAPAVAETAPTVDTSSGLATLATTSPAVTSPANTASTNLMTPSNPMTPSRTEKTVPPVTTVAAVKIPKEQSSFATQALLSEAQEHGNTDMADNLPPTTGKTKLRGLFRRVTRAFGKTADRDDDGQRQVSISVFQVALK